jgi:putative ABC transport system ATP-binding protein
MEPIVKISGLCRRFPSSGGDRPVLCGVDLEVTAGEFLCITGCSGSGKTTLLNVIGGLDRGFSGDVVVCGERLAGMGDRTLSLFRRRRAGFVFQHFNLLDHLTCAENVALPGFFAGAHSTQRSRATELLERVGIGSKSNERPPNLSGGEKQRVAIARALFMKPALVLCDEPTGDLDSVSAGAVMDLFELLRKSEGATFIAATHDSRVAARADREVVLSEGMLTAAGGT